MRVIPLPVKDACVVELVRYSDDRGFLQEIFNQERYPEEVSKFFPVQQNTVSISKKNVIRGIHCSTYAKLLTCLNGAVYDVVVDLRQDSPTFLQWAAVLLTGENKRQLLVPPNCGHGFYSMTDNSIMAYCQGGCFDTSKRPEIGLNPHEPAVGIHWPVPDGVEPIISEKDRSAPSYDLKSTNSRILPNRTRIMVIGANGQVGGSLIEEFSKYPVKYTTIGTYQKHQQPQLMQFDLEEAASNEDLCDFLLTSCRPHIICICAAFTWVDGCEKNTKKAENINHKAVIAIAKKAKQIGARIVSFSTDYVFSGTPSTSDNKEKTSYTETSKTDPLSVYGKTKRDMEEELLTVCPDALILRISRVYGPEFQGKNFVYQIVRNVGENKETKCLTDEISCATYNRDVARATRLLLEKKCSGIHHCVGPEPLSKYDWGLQVVTYLKFNEDLIKGVGESESVGAKRPGYVAMATDKLRRELPDFHFHTFEEAMQDWQSNPRVESAAWPPRV